MKYVKPLAAEALGTGFLLAAIIGSGIMGERLAGGNAALVLLCNTFPTGAMLVVIIWMFGPVSGAQFNPAVSLALCFRKQMPWPDLAPYVAAQIAGAILGVWVAHAMFGEPVWQISATARTGTGQWIAEAVATLGLLLTIFALAGTERLALPVGLYITAAYWFTASTSFANPAVTIARAFSASFAGIAPASVPGFIAAQIAGMIFALLIAQMFWPARSRA
jgi:glycerol uptake facilitator-like aquaporin